MIDGAMSSFLSAISPFLLTTNFLFGLLIFGLLIKAVNRDSSFAKFLVRSAIAILLIIGLFPLHHWVNQPLENRFPLPVLPATIDGIIVLGGVADPIITTSRSQTNLRGNAERMTEGVRLSRVFPRAQILFTGGTWGDKTTPSEASIAERYFMEQGVDPKRLILEHKAHNTWENAVYSYDLVQPTPGKTWILVTSATHMARATGVFRMAGWAVTPYPVDYQTLKEGPRYPLSISRNLRKFDAAAREWMSLLGYYLLERTDDLFPAPSDT